MSISEKDLCSHDVWLPARNNCEHKKKKCKQELQILWVVCGTDCGASGWSSLWKGPTVPPSLGVAFKVSLLTEAHSSFVLSQRPLDRGRPIFGSKESCLPRSALHLSKEQKCSCGINTGRVYLGHFSCFKFPASLALPTHTLNEGLLIWTMWDHFHLRRMISHF